MSSENVERTLADIDQHVERVAASNPPGSDLNELAFAIHNLVTVVSALAAESK